MSIYTSTKIIELGSCAFRQWRAANNRENAGNNSDRCSKVHGYRLTAKLWINADSLDERNWVYDFGGLGPLKALLQNQFDHTLCIAENDPLLNEFKDLHAKGGCDLRVMPAVGIERTAEFVFNAANNYVKETSNNRCWVSKVEVWEHENNSAIYQPLSFDIKPMSSPIKTDVIIQPLVESQPAEIATIKTEEYTNNRTGANVGSNVTSGKSGWFAGTSWA